MIRRIRSSLALALLAASGAAMADEAGDAFFEGKVRPILVARCLECHGGSGKPKGGLRLTSRAEVFRGGDSGPAAVAGEAGGVLLDAVRYVDEPRMPPKGKLPDEEIAVLGRWARLGYPWPEAKVEPAPSALEYRITDEHRGFWSFRPVDKSVEPPAVRLGAWPGNPIDRFILAGLEGRGLGPAPAADRATLIRRATFDLIGLPPTPEEVAAFLADGAPGAFEKVVDRLLASPGYGQRWGRHWLDVARYADSRDARGIGGEGDIGEAWRYRDWVVDALNRDLPYDRFIVRQIAGDTLPGAEPGEVDPDGMVATGLLTIGEWGTGDADKEKMLTDLVADQVDVVTRGFLALTVACARCHDHKFDPIPASDYYGLAGIFFSTRILPGPGAKTDGSPMLRTPVATRAHREAIADHGRKLGAAEAALRAARSTAAEALARALLARSAEVILAASEGRASPDVPASVLRKWSACLGSGDETKLLGTRMADVDGKPGVHFWAAPGGLPWVGVNSGAEAASLGTLTLPPRSVGLHPGPRNPAAIRWRRPTSGAVRVEARLADGDPNGGNGVAWSVIVRKGRDRREVASGEIDNGGSKAIAGGGLDRVEVAPGDSIELAVGPRGEYSFDTTTVTLKVEPIDPSGPAWDLAADLLPDLLAANPHADAQGRAGVWELAEIDPSAQIRPLPGHPAWADWDRSDHGPEAAKALAARVDSDPGFAAALVAEGGPFRPKGDDVAGSPEVAARRADLDRIQSQAPPPIPLALVALEGGVPNSAYEGFHDARIQVRGDYRRLGPVVARHVPQVVATEQPVIRAGSGRAELARWIASAENPLTARVMVNRVWQGHFGSGLVRTPGNFGKLGEAPTHPELLDWLAARFVADGWSLKKLHKLMMTSRTYQQSSTPPEATRGLDPDNRLWGRMGRRRLEAEAARDSLLVAAGRLDPSLGGPSTRDFQSPRRTLYQMTIRSDRSSFAPLFDAADPAAMVDRRVISTVAPQALFLLNHPFAIDQAKALAARLRALPGGDDDRIARAYLLLYGRPATGEEVAIGRDLLAKEGSGELAWQAYAQVLLCSNEMLYVD